MLLNFIQYEEVVCDMSSGDVENGKQISIEEFVQAGRTGRRNALPDILSVSVSTCGTDNITKALQKLHTTTGSSGDSSEPQKENVQTSN